MGKKGDKKTPEERKVRRDEVLDYMKTIGPFSIPAKVLAEKYGVTVDQIYDDRDYWISRISFKKMELEGKKLLMTLTKNLAITEEIKAKGKDSERVRAILASNNTAEVFTKLLENFGFKSKVADRLEFGGSVRVPLSKIMEECKDGNEPADPNSPPK